VEQRALAAPPGPRSGGAGDAVNGRTIVAPGVPRPVTRTIDGLRRRFGRTAIRDHYHRTYNSRPFRHRPISLLPEAPDPDAPLLTHVANFGGNAGDIVLPVTTRDTITRAWGVRWRARHAHRVVDDRTVDELNATAGVVVGGGGLFLADTNPNALSGWQWSCSLDALRRIDVPIAVMAVGYNRFRGQGDFDPVFTEHLAALADQSTFIGLRNSGSVQAVRERLPAELHEKVRLQPCTTTLLADLYPDRASSLPRPPVVSFNCAFDRTPLRYGDRVDEVLGAVARAAGVVGRDARIRFHSHDPSDVAMLGYFAEHGVAVEHVELFGQPADRILRAYEDVTVSVGMRGHAQMIPFGLRRPIVSLASHDKLWYFLDDIDARDWGVELREDEGLTERIVALVHGHLDDPAAAQARITGAQRRLRAATDGNLDDLATAWGLR